MKVKETRDIVYEFEIEEVENILKEYIKTHKHVGKEWSMNVHFVIEQVGVEPFDQYSGYDAVTKVRLKASKNVEG